MSAFLSISEVDKLISQGTQISEEDFCSLGIVVPLIDRLKLYGVSIGSIDLTKGLLSIPFEECVDLVKKIAEFHECLTFRDDIELTPLVVFTIIQVCRLCYDLAFLVSVRDPFLLRISPKNNKLELMMMQDQSNRYVRVFTIADELLMDTANRGEKIAIPPHALYATLALRMLRGGAIIKFALKEVLLGPCFCDKAVLRGLTEFLAEEM